MTQLYDLHAIGWKAFQDLCADIVRVHWTTEVEVYAPTKDDGADGIVTSPLVARGATLPRGTIIQAKHSARQGKKLTASIVAPELAKISGLVASGTTRYILLTSMEVTKGVADDIKAQVIARGVKDVDIYGLEWITQIIRTTPKLRAMVPRVYGMGDLSWMVDERRAEQTIEILGSMQHELSLYVTTDAHRRAVTALMDHRFALLLGDPASGKSSIAAVLAATALDLDSQNVIRVYNPMEIVEHWNPSVRDRFFWVDDAFGSLQLQPSLADVWNKILPTLRTATNSGNRFVLTSRSYIWNRVKPLLKLSAFAPLTSGQVVIDLRTLTKTERHQILYNHVKFGDQPISYRSGIKPHLAAVSEDDGFLPETARRLGSKYFTKHLVLTRPALLEFVRRPKQMLADIIDQIGVAERAMVGLLFISGGRCDFPLVESDNSSIVKRLFGVSLAQLSEAADALNGTLTNKVVTGGVASWIFKHPTIGDAFADYLSRNPQLADLFISGARLESILSEVVCGAIDVPGANIFATAEQRAVLLRRLLSENVPDKNRGLLADFLSFRTDREFLLQFLAGRPTFPEQVGYRHNTGLATRLIARLAREHQTSPVPEPIRESVRNVMTWRLLDEANASFLKDDAVKSLIGADFIGKLISDAKDELLPNLEGMIEENSLAIDADTDIDDYFDSLSTTIWVMEEYVHNDEEALGFVEDAGSLLRDTMDDLKRKQRDGEIPPAEMGDWYDDDGPSTADEFTSVSIFEDVDR